MNINARYKKVNVVKYYFYNDVFYVFQTNFLHFTKRHEQMNIVLIF